MLHLTPPPPSSRGYDAYSLAFHESFVLPLDLIVVAADMEAYISKSEQERELLCNELSFLSPPYLPRGRLCMWIREFGVLGIARIFRYRPHLLNEDFAVYFAYAGRIDLLRFIHSKGIYLTSRATVVAATRGHLEVVKFLCEVSYWHALARVRASYLGHYDVVEYLENYEYVHELSSGCTPVLQPY
ncbi:unnamed protein product [Aphanomyces euteiches]|uniref:Uncharacterized protein n=1 Tax=Aphanomyces euteiches TaxID=100861 RepID=A0A6G0W9X0_9STRA|nr:hypothetical protein Ae201684_017300 [Aphanomyces euteiches]KAH9081136.1 hypothetical protein Ae201684P_012108 [Aphanomyces euteiches]KAH9145139.1 hypothetical protein AeRB84_010954 [Aphanomyces euteiches]